jgi:protocatechuate 3,4-dioxygenase beta subunit
MALAMRSRTRRRLALALAGGLCTPLARAQGPASPGAGAPLAPTPRQSRGPYYPVEIPSGTVTDLVIERDGKRAVGDIAVVEGRVLDTAGRPVARALVEIWQCNGYGRYHHPRDDNPQPIDPLFRAYGRQLTDAQGRYRFRTIRPVAYPGRTPHIHFAVTPERGETLVTQLYVRGAPENVRDGLYNALPPAARERITAEFARGAPGEPLTARFDIVLGG